MTPPLATKTALLEAAHDLFIERGYEGVSTRDITAAAKANLASIPYYFGSKSELFVETVKYALTKDKKMHLALNAPDLNAESSYADGTLLKDLIARFLSHLLDSQSQSICWVMYREILNRDPETKQMRKQLIEFFYNNFTQPLTETLMHLIARINTQIPENQAKKISNSIIGQCVFYTSHEVFLELDNGKPIRTPAFIKEAADHVYQFSMAAIKNLKG